MKKIQVHGHRGARSEWPENTLESFDYAWKLGSQAIEFDICATQDNRLAVVHDPILNKDLFLDSHGHTLTTSVVVREQSLNQLKTYDCGSRIHPRFPKQRMLPGARIPSLEEVFEWFVKGPRAEGRGFYLNCEAKSSPGYPELFPDPESYAKMWVDAVKLYGLQDSEILFQSFDHRVLREVKKIRPSARISPLVEGTGLDLAWLAQGLNAVSVSPQHTWIDSQMVRSAHDSKVQVVVWTANTPLEWDRLLNCSVDAIISDDPKALIEYLRTKNLW